MDCPNTFMEKQDHDSDNIGQWWLLQPLVPKLFPSRPLFDNTKNSLVSHWGKNKHAIIYQFAKFNWHHFQILATLMTTVLRHNLIKSQVITVTNSLS